MTCCWATFAELASTNSIKTGPVEVSARERQARSLNNWPFERGAISVDNSPGFNRNAGFFG